MTLEKTLRLTLNLWAKIVKMHGPCITPQWSFNNRQTIECLILCSALGWPTVGL